ncbi:enoyl-CoA hydratase/isomerase family protein [Anaerococcus urinomassiliensis]|uniref:enoyl-CoA hydratase/isomerase family protein n=1 Tax=Anaerococcus urinomassiliensis TaxID=1745712 RepID=UPI00093E40A3|nr:enoyl-CoA hydratase/isomerase family protein [Anaerococcus urinomassiliensis]
MIKEKIKENIGIIYLDRPKQLNSLDDNSINRIRDILKKFEQDDEVKAVLFDSLIDKGFSAGGDLKSMYYDYLVNDSVYEKDGLLKNEFDLDKYVASYKKPIISHWFGVTMGGGIGLSINSDFIIVEENINWAMPETSLGFAPDVGVGKFIASLPQALGQYVGLCGASLEASDLIKYGFADIYIKSSDYEDVINNLFTLSKDYDGKDLFNQFTKSIESFGQELEESKIDKNMEKIDKYFSHPSIEEIFDDLKENENNDDFAKNTLAILNERDPFSLALQFEKYFSDKNLTYEEVIDRDLRIIQNSMKEKRINEGIRAKIIDKDNKPNWAHKSLEEVSMYDVKKILNLEKSYKKTLIRKS